jgi:ABC-type phosphate transport system substrate-binding protein
MSNKTLLMGATALVAVAAGFAGAASAAVTTSVYASGSSLVGPYLRQAYDCYGVPTQLVIKGSSTNNPTYASPPVTDPATCVTNGPVDTTFQLNYISTGSGTGLKGFFTHSPSFAGDTIPGTDPSPYPTIDSGNAETAMLAGDTTAYVSGGVDPATGFTFGGSGYAIPQPLYGPMIQIPLLVTPVDLAYNPVYRKIRNADGTITSYKFNIHAPRADGSGGLVLDAATYCAIFNGGYTNWNQIPAALNGGVSLQDPAEAANHVAFSVPLVLVGRSDSSGTTSVFTRHLAAQCPSVYSGTIYYPDFSSTLPTGLYNATTRSWNKANPNYGPGSGVTDVPGQFTGANGSDGVADYVEFDPNNVPGPTAGNTVTQGRIGYVGPDFALPSVLNTGNNTFGLNTASLKRNATHIVSPTAATALSAFGNIAAPVGASAEANPLNWVQTPSKTAVIAIPKNLAAYPIVGTSNLLSYTCYASATVATKWAAFIKWYFTSTVVNGSGTGILNEAGLSPMPTGWRTKIWQAFATPTAVTKPYNLNILQAGAGPTSGTGSQCNAITPGA